MSLRHLTGSDDSVQQATARPSGAVAVPPDAQAQMANSIRAHLVHKQNWPARHEREHHETTTGLPDKDLPTRCARIERPRFDRVRASIAERQLDWARHNSLDTANHLAESEPSGAKPTDTGFRRRAMWLGGIAFVLLAAGVISAVAMIESSRPLPFETWARDLTQRAGGMPGITSIAAMVARQLAGTPESARVVAPTLPGHKPGEVDAALGSHARLEPSDIVIAGLGPILASAAAAERLAADLRLPRVSVPTAKVGTGAERVLHEPPRPVFKPIPVLLSRGELDEPARTELLAD
jgi:hypothetical protein